MPRQRALLPPDDNPLWYKEAVIYELHVRSFMDSDGDGVGDFVGLIGKLDYLQDLGINAIWLLPFYPSPLKDDGYDISDYTSIQPVYGSMNDFRALVQEAHRRGIRVITELVINHTSDQHPWFQRARRAPSKDQRRDFYVWSETQDRYRDARIIFKDFEASNWTLDPVAGAYYWHRFYSHQPDLNYDNPEVRRAVLRVLDFWLRQGVDGLRIDAVPYLYEREGTSCENLPETHAFVKELREHIDSRFKNRMLLAEANQWPEDAAAYFGQGDEFHLAFHFPLMPRMFMAIRMEDRFPIIDIMQLTPSIPESCQWALFLRNHDELTLEMVTDEERDYMYRVYARDSAARITLGIRRRLAPLLNNDRKKIELMNALLFSLPGTPVIYYGDEIGMGDNFYLGDRNGVRTPMQWSPDRNAGFSRANPQRLFLPPIIDPEYNYEAINVENQQNNPDSLLWWMKRLIALRKRYRAFSQGTLQFLQPENRKVLAFVRKCQEETILVVANLSRMAQQAHLDLGEYADSVPVELFGRVQFAPVEKARYTITLGPYNFFWFALEKETERPPRQRAMPEEVHAAVPALSWRGGDLFAKQTRPALEGILLKYIRERRWFRSKARISRLAEIQDAVPIKLKHATVYLVLLSVEYTDGEPETYVLLLGVEPAEELKQLETATPRAIIARLKPRGRSTGESLLYDALLHGAVSQELVDIIGRRRRFRGEAGDVVAIPTRAFRSVRGPREANLEPRPLQVEQTNSSVVYGDRLILKLFRRLEEGINPDIEIGRFLTEKTDFTSMPPLAGSIEYRRKRMQPSSLIMLQGLVSNEGDAWQYTLDSLEHFFEHAMAHPTVQMPPIPLKHFVTAEEEIPALAEETIGAYLPSAQLLGKRTAELHCALASSRDDPEFTPEPFTFMYQNSIYHSMRSFTVQTFGLLRSRLDALPAEIRESALKVLDLQEDVIGRFLLIRRWKIRASRIRCHGDYHLGQVLYTGKDFVIIDFEGEPARSLGERRLKRSPLRDVAGMIRSFDYVTHTALSRQTSSSLRLEDQPVLEQWGRFWYYWVASTFLSAYLKEVGPARLLPRDLQEVRALLDAYILEKAVYEVGYELNNRPEWVRVPLQGILQLMELAEQNQ